MVKWERERGVEVVVVVVVLVVVLVAGWDRNSRPLPGKCCGTRGEEGRAKEKKDPCWPVIGKRAGPARQPDSQTGRPARQAGRQRDRGAEKRD